MPDKPDRKRWGWVRTPRIVFLMIVGGLLPIALIGYLLFENFEDHLRVSFAEEQTRIFETMRQEAETSQPEKGAECLEYVLAYYPSGSKQVQGSKLDTIVERARSQSARAIIGILRKKTGKDFGRDPKRWIEELRGSRN
jgi:hypothetical protein